MNKRVSARTNPSLEAGLKTLRAGQPAAARPHLVKAIKADKRNSDIHGLLAGTDLMLGNIPEAIKGYSVALDLAKSHEAARDAARRIAYLLSAYQFDKTPVSANTIEKCFEFADIDHQTLLNPALDMVRNQGPWVQILARFEDGAEKCAEHLLERKGRAALAHKLMQTCLTHGVLADRAVELILTALRRQCLLGDFYRSKELEGFLAALIVQCWFNEFAYFETAEESTALEGHRARIEGGEADLWNVLIYGLYRPLASIAMPPDFAGLQSLASVIRQTVDEPAEELELLPKIKTLHGDVDQSSKAVQQQYEENPYPRWLSVTLPDDGERRRTLERLTGPSVAWDKSLNVMIAGCGTGRQAAMAAMSYGTDSQVMAFDLSLRSLAHASYNAARFGLINVEFFQGDILKIGDVAKGGYDVIECVGVLHHLVDPMAGWRQLVDCLKPGGVMSIGLYRELGRDHCKQGRAEIDAMELDGALDNIRGYRHHVLSVCNEPHHDTLVENRDFYSVSGCRDLLFHVQERNYTLPDIAEALEVLGLKFLEFQVPSLLTRQFREAYPKPGADADLDCWDAFERDNPNSFDAMYRFWCQKPG